MGDLRAENLVITVVDGQYAFKAIDFDQWAFGTQEPADIIMEFPIFNENAEGRDEARSGSDGLNR